MDESLLHEVPQLGKNTIRLNRDATIESEAFSPQHGTYSRLDRQVDMTIPSAIGIMSTEFDIEVKDFSVER